MPDNPLLAIPAAPRPRGNPLMQIPAARLEPRPLALGDAVRSGVQDIGRIGLALPAMGEQAVSMIAGLFGADVPEDASPFSSTLGNMAKADASNAQFNQAGYAPPDLGTEVAEGATRSTVAMAPSLALAPVAAGAGMGSRGINVVSAVPGSLSTAGNQLGVDMNDPSMGGGQRLGRSLLQGGIEFAGEQLPVGKLGLGPEAALAQALRGARLPASAGRAAGSIAAESFQELLTGGAGSVAGDLTDNQEQSWSDIGDRAMRDAGVSALTAMPSSAVMSATTEGINQVHQRREATARGNEAIARAMAQAFSPDAAGMQVPVAAQPGGSDPQAITEDQGSGPVEISPEVAAEAKANPALLDLLTPSQIAAALAQDQQQAIDADPTSLEATAAGDAIAPALAEADAGAIEQRQQEAAPVAPPVDIEAESARRTLADQERVQTENRERARRRLAFALREDLSMVGQQLGGHDYDATGKLTYDEKAPNRAARMGEERARAFIREVLGDDQGALAGDDPTASRGVIEDRMRRPVPGMQTSSPAPEPTAADIVAMPQKQRLATFSALPQESRLRLQPEITRLMKQQRDEAAWAKQGLKPPKPGAVRAEPLPEQLVPALVPAPVTKPPKAQSVAAPAQPKPIDTGIPASIPPAAPQPAKPPVPDAPSPAQATKPSPPPPVNRKEIGRLARVSKAVLPSSVKVDEAEDHVRITYPGGASVQVRPVDTVPLDPAAWFDSVAKVKGAVSSAFSRAGFGATAPTKAQWLKLPKTRQQAVMAELPPVAAVSDISGGRVGLSRDALVRLVQPQRRTDTQLADAIEEEDHHVVFSALLTDEERAIVRDELARSRPELAKEDPASRAVMESAYEHWRSWNQDRQRAAVTPKTAGVFGKLLARIKAMLKWFARTPTVTGKTAAGVWANLGAARERSEVTPAATAEQAETDDANAVLIPRDESLRGSDLRKQWQKATGERPAKTESFQELARKADEVDRSKGREVAYSVPQALNDILPSEQAQSFAQWQQEADQILADDTRMADVRARALADIGLSPAEQIALRRQVGEQLAEAATSGNQNRWIEAMESASLRKASGARVAREMAARRLDLSTPEGRRELMLNHVAEMGRRWQSAFNRAKNKRDRNAAAARWQKQQQRIFKTLKDRFGIDLTDPRVGEIFSDAYSVGQLLDTVSDVAGERFHFGRLVGYYVAGNLLGGAAVAANTTGYPLMMTMQAFKAVPAMIAKAVMRSDNQNLTSAQGAWAAAHAGAKAIGRGIANGAVSFWTGRPQANRQVDPTGGSEDDANRMVAPIKNPFARLALAPFLELNRFMDEMAWTIGYNGALAAAATERKQAGDQRSHRELIDFPDADMIEKAVRWADWFTLRGTGNKAADAALQKLSSVREASPKWLEDAVDSVAPGAGSFTVNPLYFVMPFFKTIAVLTVEGAKMATPPLMAAIAVKRGVDALRADTKEGKQEAGAAALKATAYTLAGLALMGIARLGDDEDPLVKGSPSDGKSSGERSTKFAVEEPRTIGGVDYSRLDPVAMPLSLHADFRDAMKDLQGGKPAGAVLNKLGEKAWNAAVQRQFLQGLDNLFRPQYDEEGQPKGMTEKFTESVSGQLAPGRPWISTARRLTETERMERPKGEIARVYDAGRPARNTFGEREQTRADTNMAAIAGLFFPPRGKASEEAQGWQKTIYDLNAEVEKAGGKTWWPNPLGRTYQTSEGSARWTDDQYDRVREIAGRNWLELLRDSKAEMEAQDLTASDRLEFIQRMRERANRSAVRAVRAE